VVYEMLTGKKAFEGKSQMKVRLKPDTTTHTDAENRM